MNEETLSIILLLLQIFSLAFAIGRTLPLILRDRPSMTALFFAFSMISLVLSDLYWIAYTVIRPDLRMPFAVNEIGEWAMFLLFPSAISAAFHGKMSGAVNERILAALFVAASAALWIGWSGEWLEDIITGLVFGYYATVIVQGLRMTEALDRYEWILLGLSCLALIVMQILTFTLKTAARQVLDTLCYILMFAWIVVFYAKTFLAWKNREDAKKRLLLCSVSIFWCISTMYMSAYPMYYAATAIMTCMIFVLAEAVRKVVKQDDLC